MKLTEALKAWLVENCGVEKDASDDEFKKAAGVAFADGTLTPEKYAELSADLAEKQVDEFDAKLDLIATSLAKLTDVVASKETSEKTEPKKEEKSLGEAISQGVKKEQVRVKGAHEQYSTEKSAAFFPKQTSTGKPHQFAGEPMRAYSGGRQLENPSDLDKAVAGAYSKLVIYTILKGGSRSLGWMSLSEHEKELIQYAADNMKWGGSSDGGDYADIKDRPLTPGEFKALIDDGVSGGLEAAPIVFDDQVIAAPLLTGELYPLVNVVPIDRGRRVEGVITGNITGAWGGIDATAIAYFNTAGYVTAFDTTIHRWQSSVQVGLDFLSDTPIDFGAHLTAQMGERLAEDLDDSIADGNGTTQPEGVIVRAGIGTVNWTATTSIGNYESLRFGVTKQEHTPGLKSTAVFCGTETSYQRARALAVGAADARRLFGMDYDSYAIMQRPYKINAFNNQGNPNSAIFYAIMGRYRMYRRRGLTVRTSTEGDTNIRNNVLLIASTARFGGRLERGACGVWTNSTAPV